MGVSTQSTWETGGRMQVLLATRSLVGLLATLAIAKAAKLNEYALYHVVEDLPGNETQESEEENVATCSDVMARNGLNFSSFWHGAAHGLHSLHLEEIRHFFEPDATENNKIPVVNKNLSSQQTILFDAPLAGYDEHFNTMAIKVMAYFMLNDGPDFFEQGLNTLEKLTHQYHMHEIYAAAAPIYNKMKENPPTDVELCGCVNDITGNGILIEMANIARQLKYFQSKRRPRCNTWRVYSRTYRSYGNSCSSTRSYGTFRCLRDREYRREVLLNWTKPRLLNWTNLTITRMVIWKEATPILVIWRENTFPTPLMRQLSVYWQQDVARQDSGGTRAVGVLPGDANSFHARIRGAQRLCHLHVLQAQPA